MRVADVRAEISTRYVRNTLDRNVRCVIMEMHTSVRLLMDPAEYEKKNRTWFLKDKYPQHDLFIIL